MTAAVINAVVHGLMADFSETEYPAKVYGYHRDAGMLGSKPILLAQESAPATAFGFVSDGELVIDTGGNAPLVVGARRYFCVPYQVMVLSGHATAFFASRLGYVGLPIIGGPVEPRGRLRYIDGCSDTLLIGPPVKGDPCFNLLHFPPGIDQTMHTHPTIRAGMIHAGLGACRTARGTSPLRAGDMFILYPDAEHAFSTLGTEGMTLTVFHPDTDFGPSHDDHPMLNRTIVGGVSAKDITEIRTQSIQ